MSARALRLAVRNRLRSELGLSDQECDVRPDGQPPSICGQRFVAVHAGNWANSANESLDEHVGCKITITDRVGVFPNDRMGAEELDKAITGLETFAEGVVAAIHSDYNSMNAANTLIQGAVTKFVEPLRFRSAETPQGRSADWLGGEPDDPGAALSLTLDFGDARRVQKIEDLEYEFQLP